MAPYTQDSAPTGGYKSIQFNKEFIPKRVNGRSELNTIASHL